MTASERAGQVAVESEVGSTCNPLTSTSTPCDRCGQTPTIVATFCPTCGPVPLCGDCTTQHIIEMETA